MRGASEPGPSGEAGFGRCRCGHVAGDHVRVRPIGELGGGFRLEASGPCARCGPEACPRMSRPGA